MGELDLISAGLMAGCIAAVACRLRAMHPSLHSLPAALQFSALGLGMASGLALPHDRAMLAVLIGVAMFLSIGAIRWRGRAPGRLGDPSRVFVQIEACEK